MLAHWSATTAGSASTSRSSMGGGIIQSKRRQNANHNAKQSDAVSMTTCDSRNTMRRMSSPPSRAPPARTPCSRRRDGEQTGLPVQGADRLDNPPAVGLAHVRAAGEAEPTLEEVLGDRAT